MICASLPLQRGRLVSPFGWRNRPSGPDLHTGLDFGAAEGTEVLSILEGTVKGTWSSGELSGYGNVVVVQHDEKLFTLYAHLQTIAVEKGDQVAAGQLLGTVGRTAGTRENPKKQFEISGAHLHFEVLDRWPPRGKDLDRLDPGPLFYSLGIIVPENGELMVASGLPAACISAPIELLEPTEQRGKPRRPGGAAAAVAVGFFLLSALALSQTGSRKQKSRPLE